MSSRGRARGHGGKGSHGIYLRVCFAVMGRTRYLYGIQPLSRSSGGYRYGCIDNWVGVQCERLCVLRGDAVCGVCSGVRGSRFDVDGICGVYGGVVCGQEGDCTVCGGECASRLQCFGDV
jgi:hypothetical protein